MKDDVSFVCRGRARVRSLRRNKQGSLTVAGSSSSNILTGAFLQILGKYPN